MLKNFLIGKTNQKVRVLENGKIRSAGVAMAMQGSGISGVDVGSATLKLEDDGYYTLHIAQPIWEQVVTPFLHKWQLSV